MAFSGFANLERVKTSRGLGALSQAIIGQDFDRAATDALLRRFIEQYPEARDWFNLSAITQGGPLATESLVFLEGRGEVGFRLVITSPGGRKAVFESTDLRAQADLLRAVFSSESCGELMELIDDAPESMKYFFDVLKDCYGESDGGGQWPAMPEFSIQRREHASIVINHGPTRIVTDPVQLEDGWMSDVGAAPRSCSELASTILLSHTHDDHYSLSSMIGWETDASVVVAPRVPRSSLLASDVAAEISAAGLTCKNPAWGGQIVDNDVTIDVLPFYGEQPTRNVVRPFPEARNWGNCYRINTPTYSLLLLFDSGVDPEGNMVDVVAKSVAAKGPIDIVMSCCLRFREAANPGLPDYLFMVPFEQLPTLAREKKSMTLGPEGIAEVCLAAKARYFMPYAQGYVRPGQVHHAEIKHCAEIAELLQAAGAATKVKLWNFGDNLTVADL
ncbi:MAG: MBL fold metallo-hydrolase [Myxococcales bacterium]|nr:MBL fold metallo-hydrolase [Myxococcales bacterium]